MNMQLHSTLVQNHAEAPGLTALLRETQTALLEALIKNLS